MNIVDLSQYRKEKEQIDNGSPQSENIDLSFEERLLKLIHKPFSESNSTEELISIFEDELSKRDED